MALIWLMRIFPYLSNKSEIVDAIILDLPNVFPFIDFKTNLWTQTGINILKKKHIINNCGFCPALHKLQA